MNKEELAKLIYELIGPKNNIKDLTNCMTRVRVQLYKEPDDEALKAIKQENISEADKKAKMAPIKAEIKDLNKKM